MKTIGQKIKDIESIEGKICISISLPTNRTFPDNQTDGILLKNLIAEAEKRAIEKHGKREAEAVLLNLQKVPEMVDPNYNLDSLHVLVSENGCEIVKLPHPINESEVILSESFDIHHIIKAIEDCNEYLILLLSQSGVHLYNAINDQIVDELRNEDFPFGENPHYITHADKTSDAKQLDNNVREYFNRVDKAVQRVFNQTGLKVHVVSTPRNFQHLQQVADNAAAYYGNSAINYNDTELRTLANQAWETIKSSR